MSFTLDALLCILVVHLIIYIKSLTRPKSRPTDLGQRTEKRSSVLAPLAKTRSPLIAASITTSLINGFLSYLSILKPTEYEYHHEDSAVKPDFDPSNFGSS
jgi:hypothetical protein